MKAGLVCIGPIILSFAAFAQSATPVAFDAASVKVNASGDGHTSISHDGGSFRMTNVSLKLCITRAYGVSDPQVSGPGWLDSEKYDIIAKATPGAAESELPAMLQALLADRFKLTVHREKKVLSVYALTVAKGGPKFSKDKPGEPKIDGISSQRGGMTAKGITMARLAGWLSTPRAALGRTVVDDTALGGDFSFVLAWTPDNPSEAAAGTAAPAKADAPPSIFVALQEQLGLKLEARRAAVEVLVVDHAEKVPTEN